MKLPEEYRAEMMRLLKDDYPKYEESLLKPRFFGLRINTLKISPEEFEKIVPFHLKKIEWIDNGFYYDDKLDSPTKHPYYYAGLYYIQEPSAMTPANILPVEEGDLVLDLCAAPGGKSTELGAKLKNKSLLLSNDISASRAKALLKNIEVFGISDACIISETPNFISKSSEMNFDKILIDAPCSGEGMFRKDNKLIAAWERNGPDYYSKIQKDITCQVAPLLKEGGMMLYSTCTFNKMENEETVINLLKEFPELELVDIPKEYGFYPGYTDTDEEKEYHLERAARLFPFALNGEGHFLALIRKKGQSFKSHPNEPFSRNKIKLSEEAKEFFDNLKIEIDFNRLASREGKLFLQPAFNFLGRAEGRNARFLRNGLLVGEEKKNRFEPSAALAMTLKQDDYPNNISLPADDIRVDKYLKGETITFTEDEVKSLKKGYLLFCVDGFPLGWGKLSKQTMKNKYLPAWRKA